MNLCYFVIQTNIKFGMIFQATLILEIYDWRTSWHDNVVWVLAGSINIK